MGTKLRDLHDGSYTSHIPGRVEETSGEQNTVYWDAGKGTVPTLCPLVVVGQDLV